jgi:glycosyltransferase involved in cell wall biosynthesis
MHHAVSQARYLSNRHLPAAANSIAYNRRSVRAGLVSVVVPAYNAAATVERTLSSVLNQSYSDLEVLVVDDGSRDETPVLVQRMAELDRRIKLLRKANGGLASARNHGIEHAQGEFIAPLDADDLWHPEKIKKQIAQMGDQIGLVYCWSRAIDEQDRVLFDVAPCTLRGNVYAALIIKSFVQSGAPLVRTCCVDRVRGYDAALASRGAACCEDLKFNLDVAEHYSFDLVPEFLFGHRLRAGSMSTDFDAMLRSHKVVIEEARARHPELPDRLFRWADAHQCREFGLSYLGQGRFLSGSKFLLKALAADPFTTVRYGSLRVFSRMCRSSSVGELLTSALCPSGREIAKRKFVDVDPAVPCGIPISPWTRKRLAYISQLYVRRGAPMPPDTDGDSSDDNRDRALQPFGQTAG